MVTLDNKQNDLVHIYGRYIYMPLQLSKNCISNIVKQMERKTAETEARGCIYFYKKKPPKNLCHTKRNWQLLYLSHFWTRATHKQYRLRLLLLFFYLKEEIIRTEHHHLKLFQKKIKQDWKWPEISADSWCIMQKYWDLQL